MFKRIWRFKSITYQQATSTAQLWGWQAISADGNAEGSKGVFSTLSECVCDAHRNGFSGNVDPASGAFTFHGYEINVADESISASDRHS